MRGPRSDRIRPALDKVKGAIFNILGDLSGARVLDLYAGTGSLGIEALSRGAESAVFVDLAKEAVILIRENLLDLELARRSEILFKSAVAGVRQLAERHEVFDLIFIDPPYDMNGIDPALAAIAEHHLLRPGGTIVAEHSSRETPSSPALQLVDVRSYGQTRVSFFTHQEEPI